MIKAVELADLDHSILVEMYISSQQIIAENKIQLSDQQTQIEDLQSKYDKLVRMLYGQKSERFISIDPAQLELFESALDEEPNADDSLIDVKAGKRRKAKKSDHKGRQLLQNATHLERRRTAIEPDVDTSNMICIGEEVTEKLVYVESELYVDQTVRPKYVEKSVADDTTNVEENKSPKNIIHIAEKPVEIFPQVIADASLIIYLLVSKYVDHLPLHRLIEIFKRKQLKIPPATINGWLHQGINLIKPLYKALIKDVMTAGYIQADETTIRVLEKQTKKKKCHLGYYWVYHSPVNKALFFDYQKGRSHTAPLDLLTIFNGIIQCDGYEVYELIAKKNKNIKLIHCMAHTRRKFDEALSSDRVKATFVLQKIQVLYRIEDIIRTYELSDIRITKIRNRFAKPILEELHTWLKIESKTALSKLGIGKAIFYALKRWEKLSAYIKDPKLQIDNNLVENKIRPIAIGRKNYLFAGSHHAAQQAAMIYSLMATCKLNHVNVTDWLTDVFNRIQDHPINQIHELLPYNWQPKS